MKTRLALLVLIAFLALATTNFASSYPTGNSAKALNRTLAIENYLTGLESDNVGLQSSAAFFLGEMKVQEAVIPLMKMFNSGKVDCSRVMAALSLVKIGDERGLRLISYAIEHDDSEIVRNMCKKFFLYHEHQIES